MFKSIAKLTFAVVGLGLSVLGAISCTKDAMDASQDIESRLDEKKRDIEARRSAMKSDDSEEEPTDEFEEITAD